MDAVQVLGDYEAFVKDLLNRTKNLEIDLNNYPIDHLCYRVESRKRYEKKLNELMSISTAWVQNRHHGREIAKLKLKEPLRVEGYEISVIELPEPKRDKKYTSGLEHLEIVIGKDFPDFRQKYRHIWSGTDESGEYNQPVYITFKNGRSIKFHEYSLLDVIAMEGNSLTEL